MTNENPLDRLLERFQHRWETDHRWRAAMSAALGLLAVVGLCAAVVVVSSAATGVLTGLGFIAGSQPQGSGTPYTGARLVNGQLQFPTPTVSWAAGTAPAVGTIANSLTPVPGLTATPSPAPSPSPTQCTSNCGGPPPTQPTVTITVTGWSPTTWTNGQNVTISVHTSVPNDGFGFIFNFPTGHTWLSASTDPNLQTDGNGNGSYSFTIPSGYCSPGTIDTKVQVQEGSSLAYGQDAYIPCA